MAKKHSFKPLAAAIGTTFVVGVAAAPIAGAADNPFGISEIDSGYMILAEGKCGGDKSEAAKSEEGKCGGEKSEEAKSEEGKCGGEKSDEGHGGGEKASEGKCGG